MVLKRMKLYRRSHLFNYLKRCIVHLSRANVEITYFGPDIDQYHVIDHNKGAEMKDKRNVLTESARISRCTVINWTNLRARNFHLLIIPGGFGVAKTLSNYNIVGKQFKILEEAQRIIKEFQAEGRPIGFTGIGPILPSFSTKGLTVTFGEYANAAAQAVCSKGVSHVPTTRDEICIDKVNKIVSTPAFMQPYSTPSTVYDAIGNMIKETIKMKPDY